jgi:dienelactone hydrolase
MLLKKILYFVIALLVVSGSAIAQQVKSKNSPMDFGFSVIKIRGSLDSISFIVSDTTFDKKKPVFLWSQGSLPNALFWKEDATHTWRQFIPLAYEKYLKDYNFVVISKPGIPVFAYSADKDYNYIDPVTRKTPQEYYDKSYLDYYVTQANDVIDYLVKQKWVDPSRIVIAGHSQGSHVVSKLGAINPHVTQVVHLSGNPLGRFDQNVRQLRKDALLGKITQEQAQKQINSLYDEWEKINQKPNETKSYGGDTNKAWTSFSMPLVSYLLQIKVPLLIAYGTADIVADYCDLLPIDFIRAGKHNYTLKPYLGSDHSFQEAVYDKAGNKVSSRDHWEDLTKDIFDWLKAQPAK